MADTERLLNKAQGDSIISALAQIAANILQVPSEKLIIDWSYTTLPVSGDDHTIYAIPTGDADDPWDFYVWNAVDEEWVQFDWKFAVDSALSTTSENPVQNKVVTAALGGKVDKVTGKGLSTNDYTNEEKALVATIPNKADNADVAGTQTVSGNPITLTDASETYAQSLVVELEPKQDLHGQSAPYVGGAGKNKLPMTVDGIKAANTSGSWSGNVYTINSGTFTILTDDDGNVTGIKVNGTFNANTVFYLINNNTTIFDIVGGDNVILNGCPNTGGVNTYRLQMWISGIGSKVDSGNGITFDLPSSYASNNVAIVVSNAVNVPNVLYMPMLRLSTETDPTFAPWSNICPITGYDECEVDDVGKNRLAPTNYSSEYNMAVGSDLKTGTPQPYTISDNGTLSITASEGWYGRLFATGKLSQGNYIIPWQEFNSANIRASIYITDENLIVKQVVANRISYGHYNTLTLSVNDGERIAYGLVSITAETFTVTNFYLQSENETEIGYVPYHSSNATIQFGQTVYGGSVDFKTGVLTVDRAHNTYEGNNSESWLRYIEEGSVNQFYITETGIKPRTENINSNLFRTIRIADRANNFNTIYVGSTTICVNKNDIDTVANWKAFLAENQLEVVYELAEPFTIQLTPQELKLLKGTNNITTNGTTINLDYIPDNSIGDAVKASEEYTDRAVKDGIEQHLEMPYLRILDNNVDTPINNYRIYFHMIASAYTLVNMAEMLQHRFVFVEVIRNPSGTSSDELLHSVLIDPRTIDGFLYKMKVGGSDTIVIESDIAQSKFSIYLLTTGSYDDGDPTDYYVTIRMVD